MSAEAGAARLPQRPVSLARALSKLGVCSRKEAVRRIMAGRVQVDGRTVFSPSLAVDVRRMRLNVDGAPVASDARPVALAFHKPTGYITARCDPVGRPTIYALLSDVGCWVFPAGRLDKETSGLLVLTNDHRLAQRLTDPAHALPKTYHVRVAAVPDEGALRVLREGLPLPGGRPTRPAGVRSLGVTRHGGSWLEVVLREGQYRQVRRMCSAVGHEVQALVRVRVGDLSLEGLAPGEWRRLDPHEVQRLLRVAAHAEGGHA